MFEYAFKFFAVISHSNEASSMKHDIYVTLWMLQKYIYSIENLPIAPYNSCLCYFSGSGQVRSSINEIRNPEEVANVITKD